jgi:hypothetical protein
LGCWFKLKLTKATIGLTKKLDVRFPSPILAIGNVNKTFLKHLEVLKFFYGNPQACGVAIGDKSQWMVPTILFRWDLDVQQRLFKLMMKSNVPQAMAKVSTLVFNKVNP